jgi:prepilin-type N-terminal cleavage/methylation domain-containing protein
MSKEEKGFTLVELLVVIVILGVLAGIGIPTYRGFIERSHEAATLAELQAVSMAIKYYFMEHGEELSDLSKLGRYLGEDFKDGKYLVYSLTLESEQGYISATTSDPKRKNAWIIVEDIYIKGDDGTDVKKHHRGDIVFNEPSITTNNQG